ncbi:MAG: thioredoxin family protein [Phycisphaerales bacterium]|jgi:thioredoxin-related protein|nr:thioredoxin family protein [Phycisphaerales bacterium]MBT7170614.1 thioredoxin family protein [Phycisphaerales bacterium]
MKRFLTLLALLLTSSSLMAAGEIPGFHTDLESALKEARKLNKPLYIHFTTDWCGWCRRIEDDIYKKAEGKATLKPFVAVSLNCTTGKPNAAAYDAMRKNLGLNGYPALAMILPEGGLLHKFGGYLKMTPFKAELAKALANKPAVLASDAYKAKLAVRKKADAEFAAYAAKADKTSGAYLNKAMHYYLGMQYPTDATRAAKTLAKVDPKCKVGTPKDVALRANLIYQAAKIPEEKTAAFALLKKADKDGAFGYLAPAWMAKADAMLHAGYDKKTNAVAPDKAKAALVEINGILKLKTVPNAYMMQSMKHYAATQAKDVPAQIEALKAIKVLHPPAAEKIDQMLKELQPKPAK